MRKREKLVLEDDLTTELRQAREALLADPKTLKRKVRNVCNSDSPQAQALYTLAAGHRFNWTPQDWRLVLDKLEGCELTVKQWLGNPDFFQREAAKRNRHG